MTRYTGDLKPTDAELDWIFSLRIEKESFRQNGDTKTFWLEYHLAVLGPEAQRVVQMVR